MIKRFILASLMLAILTGFDLRSQSKSEIKNNFYDAESWILFEDYKEALPLYLQLLRQHPDNANFKYRVGQCYINTPGEKGKAVEYLEDAVKNINPKYKEGKFREKGAPYDALYYLANAYKINNQLDKALETYELFKKNLDSDIYDTAVVNLQIESCHNAKELMKMPLYVKQQNLGNTINENNSEFNPVVSNKEDMIVFSRGEAFYDAILYSTKTNGKWTNPLNMNELLRVDRDLFPTSLSSDGKNLYLYSSAEYDGIIYMSKYDNGTWSPIVKLNENINTKYWESHATISHDNKSLYFTSNRKGTIGGLDIYVSKRDTTGDWGTANNLGPVINSPYNEESPFLSRDDKTLFFSSRGHYNMGGYDIFYSTMLDNGEWSVPLNVGYPLNSTDDDVFFKPINEGYEGYMSKESQDGFGKQDIYRIEIFSDDHPRKFFVRGVVKVSDLISNVKDSVKISAMNITNPNQTIIVYSNPETGEYEFQLPQGDYQLTYEGEGIETVTKDLKLDLLSPSDSFVLPGTVLPKNDFEAELIVDSGREISVSKGDTIVFPLKVEPQSILEVEHWDGDSLLFVEKFLVEDSVFNYKMVPEPGKNKLVFKLTDKFNNTTSTEIEITRDERAKQSPLVRPEYKRIIAQKQIAAASSIFQKRADNELLKLLKSAETDKQQFSKIDDYISYLKNEAAQKDIDPKEVDKLALRTAVMDNILSQAAVDLLATYPDEELRALLTDLDIYETNLKTWTDLQEYIAEKTEGRISPEELNKMAYYVLADVDPSIPVIKEKLMIYSQNNEAKPAITQSIEAIDSINIKSASKWLEAFYNEGQKRGLTDSQISAIITAISSLPDESLESFLNSMIEQAEEPLKSSLKLLDLRKEKIKSPKDLLVFLLTNQDKDKYPEEAVLNSIANLIRIKNLPSEYITNMAKKIAGEKSKSWILWLALSAGILLLIIVIVRQRKKKSTGEYKE